MIAVVPARGGSKGLPRKNIRELAGVPLISHTLRAALRSRHITRVVLSTDDDEIADVARQIEGVEVPFMRPDELASDSASAIDVYLHAASMLDATELCVLLPTAPLRLSSDIDACIDLFRATAAEVVLSVTEAKPASWQQIMGRDLALSPLPGVTPSVANRQDYGTAVVPNGAIYILNIPALRRSRSYFGPRSFGYLMPASRSIDIDTEDDLLIAEALMRQGAPN